MAATGIRSRLLPAMAEHFLYLTTIGRKTGLPRQIEIWFVEHQGRYYMVSEAREQSKWVKNLLQAPRVHFSIGTRDATEAALATTPALGRVVTPEREPLLVERVSALMQGKYGWSDGLLVELAPLDRDS
jgi:deazaflavin-dependent oxidoreductase (nitroreductase family)